MRRRAIVVRCIAVALLLVGLGTAWWLAFPHRPSHSWKDVRAGVTTEGEVEAWFGPPAEFWPLVLKPGEAEARGLPARPDGQPITLAYNMWWYDGDHFMALEVDDNGLVIRCGGPYPTPPRSAVLRWWREHKPDLFR